MGSHQNLELPKEEEECAKSNDSVIMERPEHYEEYEDLVVKKELKQMELQAKTKAYNKLAKKNELLSSKIEQMNKEVAEVNKSIREMSK